MDLECLLNHDPPADRRHDRKHPDDDPAIDCHRPEDNPEIAAVPAGSLLLLIERDKTVVWPGFCRVLRLNIAGTARRLRDLDLVHGADQTIAKGGRAIQDRQTEGAVRYGP